MGSDGFAVVLRVAGQLRKEACHVLFPCPLGVWDLDLAFFELEPAQGISLNIIAGHGQELSALRSKPTCLVRSMRQQIGT